MHAFEARQIALIKQERDTFLSPCFELIKEAAEKGIRKIHIKKQQCPAHIAEELNIKYGYKIGEVREDSGDFQRSGAIKEYVIEW